MASYVRSEWSFDQEKASDFSNKQLTFLKAYTGDSSFDRLREDVQELRNAVKEQLHVYKCITKSNFLSPRVDAFSAMSLVPKNGKVFEIGCCFGTEIRGLLLDGFSAENLTACDITDGYWRLGQRIYRDEPAGVRTIFTDLACEEDAIDPDVSAFYDTQDLVLAMAVFHVLNEKGVRNMVQRIAKLCRPGGRLIATCAGSATEGPWQGAPASSEDRVKVDRYLHSGSSMEKLLKESGFTEVKVLEDAGVLGLSLETKMRHLLISAKK